MLRPPEAIPEQGLPEVGDLNFFEPTSAFINAQRKRIELVVQSLRRVAEGTALEGKVVSAGYTEGIAELSPRKAQALARKFEKYLEASVAASGA